MDLSGRHDALDVRPRHHSDDGKIPDMNTCVGLTDHNRHPNEVTSQEANSASTSKGPDDGDNDVAKLFSE